MPTHADAWTQGPEQPTPPGDDVHIWLVHLDRMQARVPEFAASLSADELDRAERFVFERDRTRFTVARGCLRAILSRYLQVAPVDIAFQYNAFGKPELTSQDDLRFNLTHSDNLALCAITNGRNLGVDVERVRSIGAAEIAERYFTPDEQRELAEVPPEQRLHAFFNGWTRKEAWLKAVGRGIGMGLDQVEVSLAPHAPAQFRKIGTAPHDGRRWSLTSFTPAPEYVAALALEGTAPQVRLWRW